ncbi:MAG: methyltransferase domain-containing protein [archaeon]|nr:methyltransferase domain-containing protein [archaeon]
MKSDEQRTVAAWSGESAESYSELIREELKEVKDMWLDMIHKHAPLKDRLRVLDIGCGPGFFSIILTMDGNDVSGIDITPDMVKEAKRNAEGVGVDVDFHIMDADSLEFEDDTFDLIVNRVVTWTIPDLFECYKEWRRVLKPNGRLLVFDSNFQIRFFDEKKEREIRRKVRAKMMSVEEPYADFTGYNTRDEYWETRPMIGTPRPQWDRNMLVKLRFKDICTVDPLFDENTPDRYDVFSNLFLIKASKPSVSEERRMLLEEHWGGNSACMSARTAKQLALGMASEYVSEVLPDVTDGEKILDLCCGCGTVSVPLMKMGCKVTSVDSSREVLEEAVFCAEEVGMALDAVLADACSLPFDDSSFDTVVCRNSMWCMHDIGAAMKEVARVLRKGGRFVITDGTWFDGFEEKNIYNRRTELGGVRLNLGLGGYPLFDGIITSLPQYGDLHGHILKTAEGCGFTVSKDVTGFKDPAVFEKIWEFVGPGFVIGLVKNRRGRV